MKSWICFIAASALILAMGTGVMLFYLLLKLCVWAHFNL